ncbi:MAG: hypothetical protein IPP81_19230 [Chitinophagaceae bacterium]|nr:hypothetical protein [Chitinophagaceae bacterium]
MRNPYTFLCFISPSGNGLKVFIEVNTEIGHHDIAYLQAEVLLRSNKCKSRPKL